MPEITDITGPTNQVLDVLLRLLILIIPIVISWFIRTYVRGSAAERNIAAIAELSNSAINYVENLDRRGDLKLPPDVKKGGYKLKLASDWLVSQLDRNGIKMTNEQAQSWVASEFQKHVGDVQPIAAIAELTRTGVDMVQNLDRNHQITLPPAADQLTYMAGLASDWVIAQLATQGANISRDDAIAWARAELLQRLQGQPLVSQSNDRLMQLATGAVEALAQLKANGQLSVRPGASGGDMDADLAIAWVLTEAVKQGLSVTSDQVAQAVVAVLRQRHALVPTS